MQLAKLTQSESDNMNIIGFVAMLLVVLMFGVLLLSYFTKSSKYLNKIINVVAGIYMALVVGTAILYFVYRHGKADIGAENDMIIIPFIGIVIGMIVVMLVLYTKTKVIEHIGTKGGFYLMNESTSTIIGDATSTMKLTNTN
jgi:hypothetical protein